MKLFRTSKIEEAVWMSAITNAYERYQLYCEQNAEKSLNDFYFCNNDIVKNAYKLLKKEDSSLIVIELFIANLYGNKFNFFSGDETKIRLSKLNEYFGYRVCPLITNNNVKLETVYGGVQITDLIEWYIYDYNVLR